MGDETMYQVLRRASMSATTVYPGGTVNAATNTATAPGVTNFSGWAAGNLAPVAANVSVGGRVTTAGGQGIRNATVMITGGTLTEPRYVRTGTFGRYQFDDLGVGQTYVISVISKKYTFQMPSVVLNVQDSVRDADFVADEQ
jgi:hypothetical protein